MRGTMCIPARQVSPSLRGLFDVNQPLAIRCFAVLDGAIRGQIWTDDLAQPTWGAVQEAAFGTLFLGGRPNARLVHELVEELRQQQDVALALWPDHPYNQLLPPAPDFHGWELEFTERPLHAGLNPFLSVPEGCGLRPIDAAWFARCRYHDYYTAYFGSAERTLEQGFGFCLVREQELLSEAFAAAAALGMIEIGTITGEAYRGRGYQDAALDDASSWFLIGHDVGEAIAIALIHPFRARGGSGHAIPGTWFLSLIYVLADRWGTGIGGMMLDAVIDEANRRGCHQIYLWTHECQNERAHRLYRSRGFARTGRTICARSLSTLPVVPPARSGLPPDLVHCCVSVSQVRNRTRPAGEKVLG